MKNEVDKVEIVAVMNFPTGILVSSLNAVFMSKDSEFVIV